MSNISNVNITGNIMRFACDTYSLNQRYDYLRGATICVTKGAWYDITNMSIQNNIFDCTMVSYFMWTWGELYSSVTGNATAPKGTTIRNNT